MVKQCSTKFHHGVPHIPSQGLANSQYSSPNNHSSYSNAPHEEERELYPQKPCILRSVDAYTALPKLFVFPKIPIIVFCNFSSKPLFGKQNYHYIFIYIHIVILRLDFGEIFEPLALCYGTSGRSIITTRVYHLNLLKKLRINRL